MAGTTQKQRRATATGEFSRRGNTVATAPVSREGIWEADAILAHLDAHAIPYCVQNDYFRFRTPREPLIEIVRDSIEARRRELAGVLEAYRTALCTRCQGIIRHRRAELRLDTGTLLYHQWCIKALDLRDLHSYALEEEDREIYYQDAGRCCYCQTGIATLPEKAPNVCAVCWAALDARRAEEQGAYPGYTR